MKLVLYNDFQLGVLQGNTVVPVGDSVADLGHHNAQEMMQMIITDWNAMQPRIESATEGGNGVALDTVTLQSPLPRPGQLMCAAGNYIEPEATGARSVQWLSQGQHQRNAYRQHR